MSEVRDRLTHRVTAGRLKLEARRSIRHVVVLLAAVAVSVVGLGAILARIAPSLVKDTRTVAFQVDNARAVKPGLNEIRVKGIPAGRVSGVELVDGKPVITADIEKEFGPVFRNARAELRPNSALEDQFIDVVDRGTPSAGEARADEPLAPSQTRTPVGVDDVLSTFDGATRSRLRALLADLGAGLGGRGTQLASAFEAAVPLLREAGRLSDVLARRRGATRRLVHNTGVLTAELSRRDRQLRTLVREGAATLSATQAGAGDLDATLRALPPTIARLTSSFAATRAVLGDVDGAVRAIAPVAPRLERALTAARDLGEDAAPAVAALQQPVRRLVPFAGSLRPLSADLATAITRLRPQTDTLDALTKDLVACEKGVKGFFQWDASMTKYGDSRGQAPRGTLAAGIQTLGLSSPEEAAYGGCTPGAPIGGRPPAPQDQR
ncbi:MAG TPA: MlaD family protein [Baekduia sp.]|nr:MlaD family protein [Baekduia sp.]